MTAVEWFADRIKSDKIFNFQNVLNQAKEMEEEQKIEFACAVYDKYNFGPQDISFREECVQFKSE